ncbi:MAG: glutamyl-tRNA synthetase [Gaiellales bacterium]|nr:glutamyl-tRNA synthetase [Gaiellales bacterium]
MVGRFAPSPSGPMHLGNARTALLAWLDTRSRGGSMVLRIEDLDRDRCRAEFAQAIRDDLTWLGLDWDEETAPQSAREPAYRAALQRLDDQGLLYECFCSRRQLAVATAPHGPGDEPAPYPGTCRALTPAERERLRAQGRTPALRVRMPDEAPAVRDRLHGELHPAGGGDVMVRRSDGLHAYQLAVVVDDAADGVTDVVRGDDLLGSAARQMALQQLLGLPAVSYAHVPLVLGEDGARLAKRHGTMALWALRASGVQPPALVAAMASSAGLGDGRPLAAAELVSEFRMERVSRLPWRPTAADLAALATAES